MGHKEKNKLGLSIKEAQLVPLLKYITTLMVLKIFLKGIITKRLNLF